MNRALPLVVDALNQRWIDEEDSGRTAADRKADLERELADVEREKVQSGLCSRGLQEQVGICFESFPFVAMV